jgi:hypothetical protein
MSRTHCALCYRPIPRRWWHRLVTPVPVCRDGRCRPLLLDHTT